MIDKIRTDVLEMLEVVPDGSSIAVGGFGLTGAPIMLCDALCDLGKKDLHIVANNAGIDPTGVGRLALEGRIRKFTGSFPSNQNFFSLFHDGHVELELVPQGTLAERMRAAGAGIPAFYTPTGAGHRPRDGQLSGALRPATATSWNGSRRRTSGSSAAARASWSRPCTSTSRS